jgi:hypothetical protein
VLPPPFRYPLRLPLRQSSSGAACKLLPCGWLAPAEWHWRPAHLVPTGSARLIRCAVLHTAAVAVAQVLRSLPLPLPLSLTLPLLSLSLSSARLGPPAAACISCPLRAPPSLPSRRMSLVSLAGRGLGVADPVSSALTCSVVCSAFAMCVISLLQCHYGQESARCFSSLCLSQCAEGRRGADVALCGVLSVYRSLSRMLSVCHVAVSQS